MPVARECYARRATRQIPYLALLPPARRGRQDRDADPAVMGDQPPPLWTWERAVVAGIGGFGALFATGWAMSKVYKRKSGPL